MQLLLPIVLMVALMWWMSRSQKKQQQQRQDQLNAMKAGDDVVTIGGLHGTLSEINKDKGTVVLDCEGIYLEFDRAAIKTIKPVVTPEVAETTETPVETVETEVETEETKQEEE